jgi:hypothetical protein
LEEIAALLDRRVEIERETKLTHYLADLPLHLMK